MQDTEKRKKDLAAAKKKWAEYQAQVEGKMLSSLKDLNALRRENKNKKIVFTLGTWDLLNEGHGRYLLKAKKAGDILVVGVASNSSRRRRKGDGHPVVGERVRAEMLAYLASVDYTIIVDEDDVLDVLRALQPDIFYTVENDWLEGSRNPEEEYIVKSYGGRIIKNPRTEPYLSSSELIDRVAAVKIRQIVFDRLGKRVGNLILAKNGQKT